MNSYERVFEYEGDWASVSISPACDQESFSEPTWNLSINDGSHTVHVGVGLSTLAEIATWFSRVVRFEREMSNEA